MEHYMPWGGLWGGSYTGRWGRIRDENQRRFVSARKRKHRKRRRQLEKEGRRNARRNR